MLRGTMMAALLLPMLASGCAPGGAPGGMAASTPVPPAAQQASPPPSPAASAATAGPGCLDNPDYATKPVEGRSGSTVAWMARPGGRGCHWVRMRT